MGGEGICQVGQVGHTFPSAIVSSYSVSLNTHDTVAWQIDNLFPRDNYAVNCALCPSQSHDVFVCENHIKGLTRVELDTLD